MKRQHSSTRPITVADIDRALEQLLAIIEEMPEEDRLWLLFDRLELDRENLAANQNRVETARARIKARSQDRKAAQP